MRALLLALALTGCVAAEVDVLSSGPVLRTCAQVMTRLGDNQACDFSGVCTIPLPDPTGAICCTDLAVCNDHVLAIERYCPDGCMACMTDDTCPAGAAVCDGNRCVACADPAMCAPCPAGTAPLVRNGCQTCTCAPASECDGPNGACDLMGETCYPGLVCSPGCAPGSGTCCANTCAAPGCPSPAPLGCRMDCPMELGCSSCMATSCVCGPMGQWSCTPVCSTAVGPCFQP